jgi:hypothetical protein
MLTGGFIGEVARVGGDKSLFPTTIVIDAHR